MAKKKSDIPEKPKLELQIPEVLKKAQHIQWHDNELQDAAPTLFSLLQPAWNEKGQMTWEPASLRLVVRMGLLRVTLTAPTARRQTTCSISTFAALVRELERHLEGPECEWEETYDLVKEQKKMLDAAKKGM